MMSRVILMISLKKIAAILNVLALICFIAGCGGGGGGSDDGGGGAGAENVTISGTADDGTSNSPISGAECVFVDLNGARLVRAIADNVGRFSINVAPDEEGYIRCAPPDIPKLILSTFSSTKGLVAGDRISGEDVTPVTTLVTDIISSENASVPMARKLELLAAIEEGDAELNLLVDLSTKLYKAMLVEQLDVRFGGDDFVDSGIGEGGFGGGVGGEAGDGADFSPIPNANCDFVTMGLEGNVLYDSALADFCDDGVVNRPDLAAIAEQVNKDFEGRQTEIMEAISNRFSGCIGRPYSTTADGEDSQTPGRYYLPIPPNVQGFVRCTPSNQPQLKLATFVGKLQEGEELTGQDVTPATTFFSHSIATKLSEDLATVKENFLDDIAGIGDVHIVKIDETITGFELPPSADPTDRDVGLVAFSATSLFNILYKNGTNVDYLAALDDLIDKKKVDPAFLSDLGVPAEKTQEWADIVNASNESAGQELDTNLNTALTKARIRVKISDSPAGPGIAGADVDITNPPSGIVCEDCPGQSNENGEVILTLTGVPETEATQIEVQASSVPGYEPATRTIKVVAFATVDLEIVLRPEFLLQVTKSGTGSGTVTSSPAGINCGADCTQNYNEGTVVTLTAQADADSDFSGWSGGGCSGTDDCTVTIDQTHTVIPTFTLKALPCNYSISPPTLSFGSDGGTGSISVTSPGNCSWTASESADWIEITTGSSGNGNGTVDYSVSANSGTSPRTAVIAVADKSHSVSQSQISDTTRPAVTITTPTSNSTYSTSSSSLDIGGTASDNVDVTQVTWSNDRGGNGTCSGTTTWSQSAIALSSGTNVITVTARDAVGNTRNDTLTVTYTPPDTTRPAVTITAPTSNSTYSTTSSSLDIAGTASDNVGVTRVTWSNDRGGSGTCSGTTTWSQSAIALSSGTNVITVTARDAVGNTRNDTLTVTYTPPAPDLVITTGSPTVTPSTVERGGHVTLSGWTVRNQGNTASGYFQNGFYLSVNSSITSGDIYLDGNSNTSLAAGAEFAWGGPTLTIPAGTAPGTYYVGILVDRTNAVSESNESNNYVSRQITVTAQDEPPVISNIGYQTNGTFDGCINSSGGTFTGTLIDVSFNYEDLNGDAHKNDGATVWWVNIEYDATNLSTFIGDGFLGSITSHLCHRFGGNTNVSIQMQLEDGAGNLSNSLTITVPKPPDGA